MTLYRYTTIKSQKNQLTTPNYPFVPQRQRSYPVNANSRKTVKQIHPTERNLLKIRADLSQASSN